MSPTTLALVAAIALCVAVVLVGEGKERRSLVWAAKPLASTGFIALAVVNGALGSSYGQAVTAALVGCWLGDVLLIPKGKATFLAGLVAFLLGHAAFIAAFAVAGIDGRTTALTALPLAAAAALVLRWLWPHLPGPMRGPVLAYIAVISGMVACAVGTGRPALVVGAVAFFLSDLSVARDRFVEHALVNRLWGLPLYYFAVVVLALSVSTG